MRAFCRLARKVSVQNCKEDYGVSTAMVSNRSCDYDCEERWRRTAYNDFRHHKLARIRAIPCSPYRSELRVDATL